MFDVFVKVVISFLITNWIYSEAVLFYPPLHDFSQSVYQAVKIPTHDQWPAIASSEDATRLATDIDSWFGSNAFRGVTSQFGDWFSSARSHVPQASSGTNAISRALEATYGNSYIPGVEAFMNDMNSVNYEVLFDDVMTYVEFSVDKL